MSKDGDGVKEKRGMFARLLGRGEEAPADPAPEAEAAQPEAKRSWKQRLFGGLFRSSQAISQGIAEIFTKRKLDALTLDELEDVLLRADLGVGAATRITQAVGKARYEKDIEPDEVRAILAREVERILAPAALPLDIDDEQAAVRRAGGRRQRLRQDDDHRQARRQMDQ